MEINGKVYRNLEGQVAYLTQYLETNALANEMGIKVLGRVDSVDDIPAGDYEYGDAYMVGEEGATPYRMVIWSRDAGDGNPGWFDIGYFPTAPDEFSIVEVNGSPVHIFNADTKLDKDTSETVRDKVYAKAADGSQIMINVSGAAESGSIPQYVTDGKLNVGTPTANEQAANKGYVDGGFVGKDTGTSTYYHLYCKNPDGTQGVINGHTSPVANAVPIYRSGGELRVGTPTDNSSAATKKYVDDAVGQLLYLHNIYIYITVDASNALWVQAQIINSSATALTSIDRATFRRMEVEYGAFGANLSAASMCSVTKMPTGLRQDELDEPYWGFLYQYFSGGNLVSAFADNTMTMTVIDTVESF